MAKMRKSSVYQESFKEPGLYEYRPERAAVVKRKASELWNVEAVKQLNEMYELLGIPPKWRR